MLRWWQDYFESTKINRATSAEFGIKALSYEALDYDRNPFAQCAPEVPLPRPGWRRRTYLKLAKKRKSTRSFSKAGPSRSQLGMALSALAQRPDGTRNYASGGALYPVHVCVVDLRGSLGSAPMAYRYDAPSHALGAQKTIGPVVEVQAALGVAQGSDPPMVLAFVADLREVTRKYGSRGTRFALLEVGAMAHAFALSLVAVGLVGYEVGGHCEDDTLELLGLAETEGVVLHAMAFGRPE